MANLSIVTYKIKELVHTQKVFQDLKDPHGYLATYNKQWIAFLHENPSSDENDLALILTVDGEEIVGKLALYAGLVNHNNEKKKTFWLSAFFLEDDYKSSGAGGLMLLSALQFSKCLLACGSPREDTQKLYKVSGFHELGPLRRYVYFYNPAVIAKKYIHNTLLASVLSCFISPFLKGYYRVRRGFDSQNFIFSPVKRFSKDIDKFQEDIRVNHFPKSSNLLNWVLQYSTQNHAFQIFDDKKIVGYCLMRIIRREFDESQNLPDMNVGVLLDYFLEDNSLSAKKNLLLFAIDFFRKKKVDLLEFQHHDTIFSKLCIKYGMLHLGGNKVLYRPSKKRDYCLDSQWIFTHGTSDALFIGY